MCLFHNISLALQSSLLQAKVCIQQIEPVAKKESFNVCNSI